MNTNSEMRRVEGWGGGGGGGGAHTERDRE